MLNPFVYVPRCLPHSHPLFQPCLKRASFFHRLSSSAATPAPSLVARAEQPHLHYDRRVQSCEAIEYQSGEANQRVPHGAYEKYSVVPRGYGSSIRVALRVTRGSQKVGRVLAKFLPRNGGRLVRRWALPRTETNNKDVSSSILSTALASTGEDRSFHTGICTSPQEELVVGWSGFSRGRSMSLRYGPRSLIRSLIRRRWRPSNLVLEKSKGWPRRILNPNRRMIRPHNVSLNSWPDQNHNLNLTSPPPNRAQNFNMFDQGWSVRFSRLQEELHSSTMATLDITDQSSAYAGVAYTDTNKSQSLLERPDYAEKRLWQDAMLRFLRNSPRQALKLLFATMKNHTFRPPRNQVEDCLHLLARHYLYRAKPRRSEIAALWRLTYKFLDGVTVGDVRIYSIPHTLLRLLLKHVGDTQAIGLSKRLSCNRVRLHPNSMLHFLARFVKMGRGDLALKVLRAIAETGFDLSRKQIQSACVRLLRARWKVEEPYALQSRILTQMLEMGINPNTDMYNVILLNMIEAHDFETAWQMYAMAQQNDFATNSITLSILVKGARLSGNANVLNLVLREVREDPEKLQDTRLVSATLHAICLFSPGDEFPSMLDFYKQHCDLRPLLELGLCGPETKARAGAEPEVIMPNKYILGQMIGAYNKLHQDSKGLILRYNAYHDLVRQSHPLIAPLAQDDYVANSFILAFGKSAETLPHCTTVIKHMLEVPPSPDQPPYAIPTGQTWNILAAAYFRHNQKLAAEKVFSMMRERGLEADQVTWNIFVHGYAGLQDVDAAVDTMKRLEAAGHEVDSYTLRGLGRLRNRDRLLEALKKRIEEKAPPQEWDSSSMGLLPADKSDTMARCWETKDALRESEIRNYFQAVGEKVGGN